MATNDLHRALGEVVHTLRTLRGMSQADLAARSELSDVYVRQIELGERDISISVLAKLAHGLECTPRDLLPADGRSAVETVVGATYSNAPEQVQRAIVFLLKEDEHSTQKQALLTLIAEAAPPPLQRRPPRKNAAPVPKPPPAPAPAPVKGQGQAKHRDKRAPRR